MAGFTTSAGQVKLVPLQVSAASHEPAAGRQVLPALTAPQVPLAAAPAAALQAWQSSVLLSPQAVSQQTLSAQKPLMHWLAMVHG